MKYSVLGVEYLLEKINTGILSHGFDEYILLSSSAVGVRGNEPHPQVPITTDFFWGLATENPYEKSEGGIGCLLAVPPGAGFIP